MTRLSVCLSFDWDAMSARIAQGNANPATLSHGAFGAFALPRILDLLRRHGIQATFFVPGHTALAYPSLARRIDDEGHEIGHHGWIHENPALLDETAEREVFNRGLEALEQAVGVRPFGYRSPGAALSERTVDLLVENGMVYDSSCSATDFTPYYLRTRDKWSTTEPYEFGPLTNLIELPFSWGLDDWPHFEFALGVTTEQSTPSAVREIWQAEFDYAYDNCEGGVFELCMHPEVIGRGHRIRMLESLIEHMKNKDAVVFEPSIEYAKRWRDANPLEAWATANPILAGGPRV